MLAPYTLPIALAVAGFFSFASLSLAAAPPWPEPTAEGLEFFERTIRPILANACFECHSATAQKIKGDLQLDTWAGISKGGSSGPVIFPGDPDKSPLVQAIRWLDKDFRMPPKDKLSDTVRIELERWVKMGAPFPRKEAVAKVAAAPGKSKLEELAEARKKWQFQPPAAPPPPNLKNPAWSAHPVDQLLMAKWEQHLLVPAAMADKRTLLRRATYDLTGLPPTPQEVIAFMTDTTPSAFARVVERLLASPAYGERWGRHWLDLVRYADTGGDSADYPIPEAYKYRDYIIDSFNADKPYDAFLKEQLAGDLLPHANPAQKREHLIATGYIAISRRFGVQPEMNLTIDDTIDNLGKTMLGLSISCARCHDQKFDPIPTKDYYALWGIFGSTKYPFPGSENVKRPSDFVPLQEPTKTSEKEEALKAELEQLEAKFAALKLERAQAKKDPTQKKGETDFRKEVAALEKSRSRLLDQLPKVEMAYAVSEAAAKDEPVHIRGDQYKKGPVAPRGFLSVLGGQQLSGEERSKSSGRLQLANWVCDPKNPLTARVMVNRIWQHHFGKGLVASVNDWGKQGKPATNPQLIDFLATTFIKGGYSVKAMHRLIMNSKAYQLSCEESAANLKLDPTNEWGWRFNRQRLDAEQLRDAILTLSGELDRQRPGAHPFPPQDKWDWTQHKAFAAIYDNNARSVYQMQQRIKKHPFFGLFDGADTNACTGERPVSVTPLQALYMLNDPLVKTESEKLAARLLREQPTDSQRVLLAYWLAFSRACTPDEQTEALNFIRVYTEKTDQPELATADKTRLAFAAFARVLLTSNEFVFID